uniref:Tyr recombinase domain-containing protein n=1 Tax=Mycena chlorophos TaxID=658473 RepID=A0ABQ0LD05_MYCCL|nr:predicted protein [Mycena chlorophos]
MAAGAFDVAHLRGLQDVVSQPIPTNPQDPDRFDLDDDLAAEVESLYVGVEPDVQLDSLDIEMDEVDADGDVEMTAPDLEAVRDRIAEASKGVTDGTHAQYQRLMKAFTKFLIAQKFITGGKDAARTLFTNPPVDTPTFIVAWIMNRKVCDEKGLDGLVKDASIERGSFSHAQKMRAALTYGFGRFGRRGQGGWKQESGTWVGNPSVSDLVGWYMKSLRKAKENLSKMFHYNNQPQFSTVQPVQRRHRNNVADEDWGCAGLRLFMQAIYAIAFLCLLRFDEALQIQVHDIEFVDQDTIILTLPFRKTAQNGGTAVCSDKAYLNTNPGIKPFVLYAFPEEEAHLCPVRALAHWLNFSGIKSGYLFPHMNQRGEIDHSRTMVSVSL